MTDTGMLPHGEGFKEKDGTKKIPETPTAA